MSNDYYTASGNPLTRALASSADIRAEFAAVQQAFDLLPTPYAGGDGFTGGTFYGPSLDNATFSSGTIGAVGSANNVSSYLTQAAFKLTAAEFPDYADCIAVLFHDATTETSLPADAVSFSYDGGALLSCDINGNVVVGDLTAALATTATDGFLHVTSCAGAPTGVPTNFPGSKPIVVDTTNNRLYVYNGSWKYAALT